MGEEEELGMDLFGLGENLELNLGNTPEDFTGSFEANDENIENNNSGEDVADATPEIVAGEEDTNGDNGPDVNDDADNTTSPSMYSSFANLLHEEGLLSDLESNTEIKSVDDLKALVEAEISRKVEEKYNPEELEDIRALRNGISREQLAEHHKVQNQLDSIGQEHIENNGELRKQLIYQNYINQGLSEDKASSLVNRSVDSNYDTEDAAEALQNLRQFQAYKLQAQQEQLKIDNANAQAAYEAEQAKLKNSIYASEEVIKGQPFTKVLKDRVYNSMTNVIGNSPEGNPENALMKDRRENPIEFDSKLYYLYEITKGFTDFGVMNKRATSSAANELEQALRSTNFIEESGMPNYLQDNDSYDGIGTEFVF